MDALLLGVLILVFNLPFGYWRGGTEKLSIEWFASIHVPVPFVILARRFYGFDWHFIPLFVAFFFVGQFAGKRLRGRVEKSLSGESSSLLFVDLWRLMSK